MVHLGCPKGIASEVDYSSQWSGRITGFRCFDQVLTIVGQALTKLGIAGQRVGERGSSSHCPVCGSADLRRSPRWRLTCNACGDARHSNQAGSRNILRFQTASVGWNGPKAGPQTGTKRWDRHLWATRSVDPRRQNTLPRFLQAA